MKHIPPEPNAKANERIAVAITPLKNEIYKKLCHYYKRNLSEMTNLLIDSFLAEQLFNEKQKLNKIGLTENASKYAKEIIDSETCSVCQKRRSAGGTLIHVCPICNIEEKIYWHERQKEEMIEYLKKEIANPSASEEDKEYSRMSLKKIKEGTSEIINFNKIEEMHRKLKVLKEEEEKKRKFQMRKEVEEKYEEELKNIKGFKKRLDFIQDKLEQEDNTKK